MDIAFFQVSVISMGVAYYAPCCVQRRHTIISTIHAQFSELWRTRRPTTGHGVKPAFNCFGVKTCKRFCPFINCQLLDAVNRGCPFVAVTRLQFFENCCHPVFWQFRFYPGIRFARYLAPRSRRVCRRLAWHDFFALRDVFHCFYLDPVFPIFP